jgi:hypothetical protein
MVASFAGMKILVVGSVKKVQPFGHIFYRMRVHKVHDDAHTLFVCFADQVLQVGWGSET